MMIQYLVRMQKCEMNNIYIIICIYLGLVSVSNSLGNDIVLSELCGPQRIESLGGDKDIYYYRKTPIPVYASTYDFFEAYTHNEKYPEIWFGLNSHMILISCLSGYEIGLFQIDMDLDGSICVFNYIKKKGGYEKLGYTYFYNKPLYDFFKKFIIQSKVNRYFPWMYAPKKLLYNN